MNPDDLVACIEKAFGSLDRPPIEELAAEETYVDQSFIDSIGSRTWQALRPLRHYIGDGSDIVLLSARAYQYYLPAYLIALVDESGDRFYLDGVLDSLWYESWLHAGESLLREFYDPRKGFEERLHELEIQMPHLTDQERRSVAETRVGIAEKLAYIKEMTGHDWQDRSYLRARWEERMPLLTDEQKKCIARIVVRILERTTDPFDAPRIQTMLDKYWLAFLGNPRDR
jgi:hypothetical protein